MQYSIGQQFLTRIGTKAHIVDIREDARVLEVYHERTKEVHTHWMSTGAFINQNNTTMNKMDLYEEI